MSAKFLIPQEHEYRENVVQKQAQIQAPKLFNSEERISLLLPLAKRAVMRTRKHVELTDVAFEKGKKMDHNHDAFSRIYCLYTSKLKSDLGGFL